MKSVFLLLCALFWGVSAAAQGYRIQPGDVLEISVLEDSNLNRQVLVRPDGGISLPIAGNIRAGGNTVSAVERILTERLASGFSITPTVSVALTKLADEPDPNKSDVSIYVIGEVNRPGEAKVDRGSTILQALAQAGGLSRFAAESRIQLRRIGKDGREIIYLFDYAAVQRGARIEQNIRVRKGDTLVVPERGLFE